MRWFSRNAQSIEAAAAIATALVAVIALLGVKFQLDENDRLQRAASARAAYRSHLELAVAHPEYAAPTQACALLTSAKSGSYAAFVDHLLYSAEQMLVIEAGWQTVFADHLSAHNTYLCQDDAPRGDTQALANLLSAFRHMECEAVTACE